MFLRILMYCIYNHVISFLNNVDSVMWHTEYYMGEEGGS